MTTDKQKITVELQNPLDQPLQGWIEVIGIPVSSSIFRAYEVLTGCFIKAYQCIKKYIIPLQIICFEQNENQEPFDEESHNEICQIFDLMREGDLYKFKN